MNPYNRDICLLGLWLGLFVSALLQSENINFLAPVATIACGWCAVLYIEKMFQHDITNVAERRMREEHPEWYEDEEDR